MRFRKALFVASVIWLASLFVLVIFLSMRGSVVANNGTLTIATIIESPPLLRDGEFYTESSRKRIGAELLSRSRVHSLRIWGLFFHWEDAPLHPANDLVGVKSDQAGSNSLYDPWKRTIWTTLPHWLTYAIGTSVLIAAWVICSSVLMSRRCQSAGVCKNCGYDLFGLESNRCPECGRQFVAGSSQHSNSLLPR